MGGNCKWRYAIGGVAAFSVAQTAPPGVEGNGVVALTPESDSTKVSRLRWVEEQIDIGGAGPRQVSISKLIDDDQRLTIVPNPARRGETRLIFRIDQAGPADLSVYDVAGRRVRSLVSEGLSTGLRSIEWDARDDRGEEVSPGVYFVRLVAGSADLTRKIVLTR